MQFATRLPSQRTWAEYTLLYFFFPFYILLVLTTSGHLLLNIAIHVYQLWQKWLLLEISKCKCFKCIVLCLEEGLKWVKQFGMNDSNPSGCRKSVMPQTKTIYLLLNNWGWHWYISQCSRVRRFEMIVDMRSLYFRNVSDVFICLHWWYI